jgi:2-methylcitrate dehydratase PrpD
MGGAEFSYESSLATHSIAGTFGAAAAAACAAGLDARQMRWVLDYTAQQSSGIVAWRRDTDHIEKAFVFGGMTARNGVTAALVVRSGWNGVEDIFSGDDNFFKAYAPSSRRISRNGPSAHRSKGHSMGSRRSAASERLQPIR